MINPAASHSIKPIQFFNWICAIRYVHVSIPITGISDKLPVKLFTASTVKTMKKNYHGYNFRVVQWIQMLQHPLTVVHIGSNEIHQEQDRNNKFPVYIGHPELTFYSWLIMEDEDTTAYQNESKQGTDGTQVNHGIHINEEYWNSYQEPGNYGGKAGCAISRMHAGEFCR